MFLVRSLFRIYLFLFPRPLIKSHDDAHGQAAATREQLSAIKTNDIQIQIYPKGKQQKHKFQTFAVTLIPLEYFWYFSECK